MNLKLHIHCVQKRMVGFWESVPWNVQKVSH